MNTIQAIKPGPKPLKPDGTPDERRHVNPPNQPKYPDLNRININREIKIGYRL
jgi:hypothetical protein